MARAMQEEDARNSLVYFTDVRDGKEICGFGIDVGRGLPLKTRMIFCRNSEKQQPMLLDESHPLITIRPVTSDERSIHSAYFQNLIAEYIVVVSRK